ncbi:thioesterase family protein [Mycolicibacterium sp. CBM1]
MSSTTVAVSDDRSEAAATRSGLGSGPAFFVEQGNGGFRPTAAAAGCPIDEMLSAPAVAALAASTLERKYGALGFAPVRLTIDRIKSARMTPTYTQTRLVRHGQRMRIAECDILQDDWIVARATLLQYRSSHEPVGSRWQPEQRFVPPEAADEGVLYLGGDRVPWSPLGSEHHNAERKRAYFRGPHAVAGRAATPFVRAVIVAETVTCLVTNLGTHGFGYLSGDLTVALARQPHGEFVGVQAESRACADGLSVGTVTLFDDAGAFGTAMATAIADPAARGGASTSP